MIEFHTGRLSVAIAQLCAVGGRVYIDCDRRECAVGGRVYIYCDRRECAVSRHGFMRVARFNDGNDIADAVINFRDHVIGLREVKA